MALFLTLLVPTFWVSVQRERSRSTFNLSTGALSFSLFFFVDHSRYKDTLYSRRNFSGHNYRDNSGSQETTKQLYSLVFIELFLRISSYFQIWANFDHLVLFSACLTFPPVNAIFWWSLTILSWLIHVRRAPFYS